MCRQKRSPQLLASVRTSPVFPDHFRFPLKELRREARLDLAPPWVFTRELSGGVTPLRFLG